MMVTRHLRGGIPPDRSGREAEDQSDECLCGFELKMEIKKVAFFFAYSAVLCSWYCTEAENGTFLCLGMVLFLVLLILAVPDQGKGGVIRLIICRSCRPMCVCVCVRERGGGYLYYHLRRIRNGWFLVFTTTNPIIPPQKSLMVCRGQPCETPTYDTEPESVLKSSQSPHPQEIKPAWAETMRNLLPSVQGWAET